MLHSCRLEGSRRYLRYGYLALAKKKQSKIKLFIIYNNSIFISVHTCKNEEASKANLKIRHLYVNSAQEQKQKEDKLRFLAPLSEWTFIQSNCGWFQCLMPPLECFWWTIYISDVKSSFGLPPEGSLAVREWSTRHISHPSGKRLYF